MQEDSEFRAIQSYRKSSKATNKNKMHSVPQFHLLAVLINGEVLKTWFWSFPWSLFAQSSALFLCLS